MEGIKCYWENVHVILFKDMNYAGRRLPIAEIE